MLDLLKASPEQGCPTRPLVLRKRKLKKKLEGYVLVVVVPVPVPVDADAPEKRTYP